MNEIQCLSTEDIRMLAELEREMDAGEKPYVRVEGDTQRSCVDPDCMKELGLKTGQTITNLIFCKILEWNIAFCQTQIALKKAAGQN